MPAVREETLLFQITGPAPIFPENLVRSQYDVIFSARMKYIVVLKDHSMWRTAILPLSMRLSHSMSSVLSRFFMS